ncbi:MAG: SPOR domain-containing protein [Pseudomonadota bacterium]
MKLNATPNFLLGKRRSSLPTPPPKQTRGGFWSDWELYFCTDGSVRLLRLKPLTRLGLICVAPLSVVLAWWALDGRTAPRPTTADLLAPQAIQSAAALHTASPEYLAFDEERSAFEARRRAFERERNAFETTRRALEGEWSADRERVRDLRRQVTELTSLRDEALATVQKLRQEAREGALAAEALAERESVLAERDETLGAREGDILGRLSVIEARESALERRENGIEDRENTLFGYEEALKSLDRALNERRDTLYGMERDFEKRSAELLLKETEMLAMVAELESVRIASGTALPSDRLALATADMVEAVSNKDDTPPAAPVPTVMAALTVAPEDTAEAISSAAETAAEATTSQAEAIVEAVPTPETALVEAAPIEAAPEEIEQSPAPAPALAALDSSAPLTDPTQTTAVPGPLAASGDAEPALLASENTSGEDIAPAQAEPANTGEDDTIELAARSPEEPTAVFDGVSGAGLGASEADADASNASSVLTAPLPSPRPERAADLEAPAPTETANAEIARDSASAPADASDAPAIASLAPALLERTSLDIASTRPTGVRSDAADSTPARPTAPDMAGLSRPDTDSATGLSPSAAPSIAPVSRRQRVASLGLPETGVLLASLDTGQRSDARPALRQTDEGIAAPEAPQTVSYLQAGIFIAREYGTRLRDNLERRGIEAAVLPTTVRGQQAVRVRVGPIASEDQRRNALSELRDLGITDAYKVSF